MSTILKSFKLRSLSLFFLLFLLSVSYLGFSQETKIEEKKLNTSTQKNKSLVKKITITGQITDETNQPVPGTSIIVKGTNIGVATDVNGKFTIEAPENGQLRISFIGYEIRDVDINSKSVINVAMVPSQKTLDEVVVTAFGTQKKENVTGSIATISGKDLVTTPVGNITNMLAGSATGISGLQTSGEPGVNSAQIYIRGIATYGNTQPLFVIDGVEQPAEQAYAELNGIDSNEIEGVSILKDAASTAVYGIRGANGVVIITTKRGKEGKPVFSLSLNYGSTKATNLVKTATSYEWASMRNEAILIGNKDLGDVTHNSLLFSADDLWKFKNNRDYTPAEVAAMSNLTEAQKAQLNASPAIYYGNSDVVSDVYGNSAPQMQLNFNASGGNDRLKYYTSLGYFKQEGIGPHIKYGPVESKSTYERYNFRSNFDLKVDKNTSVSLNLSGQFSNRNGDGANSSAYGITNPFDLNARYKILDQAIVEGNATAAPIFIDGKMISGYAGAAGSFGNPLGLKQSTQVSPLNAIVGSGLGFLSQTLLDNSLKILHKMDYLTKGLSIRATANFQQSYTKWVAQLYSLPTYTVQRNQANPNLFDFFGGAVTNNTYNQSAGFNSTWSKMYFDAGIDYSGTFGDHKVTGLVLGKASQYSQPSDANNTPSGVMGLVGRVTYNFKERYLFEANLGYNGTEQFIKGKRFGFFPAYSIGWVPTNEGFLKGNKIVDFFKIRASYGEVGNDLLGTTGRRYLYLPNSYSMNLGNGYNQGYYFGNSNGSTSNPYYKGAQEGNLGNPLVTWERSQKLDIGVESRFLKDRLTFTADYFNENRNNILTTSGIIPVTFGAGAPPINIGQTYNAGYEANLGWNDKIKEVGYSVNLGLSYSKNKVVYRAEAPNPYDWMNQTGKPIGQYFGLISDGFFNTPQELANRPFNTYSNNVATLGDIRYLDLNGDGKIDNKDIAPIGYTNLPQYHFNGKFGVNYKGFDISVLVVGSAHGSYYLNSGYTLPYYKSVGNVYEWAYNGRWTADKVASGANIIFPRSLIDGSSTSNSFLTSDFWLKSNDFVRIKNVEVGYTFSTKIVSRIGLSNLRLYCNANNIFTFKNALSPYGIDPETTDTGQSYLFPLTQVVNIGLSMKF